MGPKKPEIVPPTHARFGRVKNSLRMGILGLPNVGKSSLFNLICKMEIAAENYPFCTIDPNESRCIVPDDRFDHLVKTYKPSNVVPAHLLVTDIAGLVKGAAEGAGLGNAFLSHVAAVDGLFHVVRAFDDKEVVHVEDSVDPVRDLDIIQEELCKKDLTMMKKELDSFVAKMKLNAKRTPTEAIREDVMKKCVALLEDNKSVSNAPWSSAEVVCIRDNFNTLLTTKPIIYLVNTGIKSYCTGENKYLPGIKDWVAVHGGGKIIPFSVKFEEGLFKHRDDPVKVADIEKKAGIGSCMDLMVRSGYEVLDLIYFFTCGPVEVRAWTVLKGSTAPQAAGVIHTDFERCFIKAECCSYDDFKDICTKASMEEVKAAGKYRQEGKQYIVQSGDILNIQHNAKK